MMQLTKLAIPFLCFTLSGVAAASTVYSGEFDYRNFKPAASYFKGHSAAEIDRLCKTGEHASTDDIAQCQHREFEQVSAQLDRKLEQATSVVARSDKSREANGGRPVASLYFSSSQEAWVRYRDDACYAEAYMMGEATERYINFWACMAKATKKRIAEVDDILKG